MKIKYLRLSRILLSIYTQIKRHFIFISVSLLSLLIVILGVKAVNFIRRQSVQPIDLLGFFGSPKEVLDSTGGYTNFLLLGIRGEGDDSPDLSDTILILTYQHDTKSSSLISIPRDLWVQSLKTKINAVYHYGQIASPSSGIKLAESAIFEITGIPIHYTAVVDFSFFKEVIDKLGGVDVDNPIAFTDPLFPIPGMENALPISSRYETISFPAGIVHLDGENALKFVRSRHAEGDQGTDFARSNRQRLVISSLREKILNPNLLLNETKVQEMINIVNKNLNTNLTPNLYPTLLKLALDVKDQPIKNISLSNLPDENGVTILYNPPSRNYNGEWVLVPKDNNYQALKQYLSNKITGSQ